MLSDQMRSVARDVGLTIAPYQSELGFTAVCEHGGGHLVFVLNTRRMDDLPGGRCGVEGERQWSRILRRGAA